jgi:hypothetical protein
MQKGFAPILIVVLIALVVGGGAYYLGTKKSSLPTFSSSKIPSTIFDETANWKTYTNTKFGYSLKYPADKFTDCSEEDVFMLNCPNGEGRPDFGISTDTSSPSPEPYKDYFDSTTEAIKVGNIDGTRYTNRLKSQDIPNVTQIAYSRLPDYIMLSHNGRYFSISYNDYQMVSPILSTFKFTD